MKCGDRYTEISGIRTRYWQAGETGPAVVLIHGIASSVEDWEANIAALAQRHRVFALDLVGCGHSDKPADYDYSLESLSAFVLEFMSAMNIEAAHLAGFSMGGHLALKCAHTAPERVLSLVLSAPAGMELDTIINFRLATVRGLGEVLTRPSRFGMRTLLNAAYHDRSKVTDAMIGDRLCLARLPGAQAAFLKMLRGFVRLRGFEPNRVADLQSWLPAISCPTLVIWGKQDKFVSVRHAEILRQRMPDCRVAVCDGSGHLSQAEQSEWFNEEVRGFLTTREVSPGTA